MSKLVQQFLGGRIQPFPLRAAGYIPQNNLSYSFKAKTLSLIYDLLLSESAPSDKPRVAPILQLSDLDFDKNSKAILQYNRQYELFCLESRIEHCERVKAFNRQYLAAKTAEVQTRIRIDGNCYGAMYGCLLAVLFNRRASRSQRMAVVIMSSYIGGWVASWRHIDILYDKMSPFINEEMKTVLEEYGFQKHKDKFLPKNS